jgi:mannose-6-phosphate isomerase
MIVSLPTRKVTKIWGRRDLPAPFGPLGQDEEPVGEIWFEPPQGFDSLLVKYLFTSDRLSIQVHPNDTEARAAGRPRGKDEAWLILEAAQGACVGLGTRRPLNREELRRAAEDGSIVDLVDWRPVSAGEIIYSPAGTLHAIGSGLSIIEVQQNCDLTYRLYDYGRPRELHVDAAVAAARPSPFDGSVASADGTGTRVVEASGGAFVLERWRGPFAGIVRPHVGRPLLLVPVNGTGRIDDVRLHPGVVAAMDEPAELRLESGAELLVVYDGAHPVNPLI